MGRILRQLRRIGPVALAVAFMSIASVPPQAADPPGRLPCNLKVSASHSVVAIKDARTIVVDDGSVVELSGILPPFVPRSGETQDVWAIETDAIEALSGLVAGRAVMLAYVRPKRNRYGAVQAHVFVLENGPGSVGATGTAGTRDGPGATAGNFRGGWVQKNLLSRGFVRAYEPAGQSDCFGLLVSFERRARSVGLSLWRHPLYRPIAAGDISRLWRSRGSYVRVVGRIRSVARRSTHTYLNFGDNWRTDFTIAVPRSLARAHPAWAAGLEGMASRTVEIAGWIVGKNGPSIELEHREQLQVLE